MLLEALLRLQPGPTRVFKLPEAHPIFFIWHGGRVSPFSYCVHSEEVVKTFPFDGAVMSPQRRVQEMTLLGSNNMNHGIGRLHNDKQQPKIKVCASIPGKISPIPESMILSWGWGQCWVHQTIPQVSVTSFGVGHCVKAPISIKQPYKNLRL